MPCGKVLGGWRCRQAKAFRPASVVNVSAMSFGSLSAPPSRRSTRAAALAGCLHNTGEGGVAPHHLNGGELIWQIGTGYFGCRATTAASTSQASCETVERRGPASCAIEIKLSQGAKPGLGGVLAESQDHAEIARIRGIPSGPDCISPSRHIRRSPTSTACSISSRSSPRRTGLPVGIKSAVGEPEFWQRTWPS